MLLIKFVVKGYRNTKLIMLIILALKNKGKRNNMSNVSRNQNEKNLLNQLHVKEDLMRTRYMVQEVIKQINLFEQQKTKYINHLKNCPNNKKVNKK